MALSKITTESLLDGEITLPKLSSGTDGNIISYDASGNPVAIATGNDGQVLTSTGAGSPPAFETPAAGGSWNLIATAVASSSASLTITGLNSTYDTYAVALSAIVPSGDNNIYLRLGDSSGIDSGSTDYQHHIASGQSSADSVSGNSSAPSGLSYIPLSMGNVGSATGEGMGAMLYIHNPSDSTEYTMISGTYNAVNDNGNTRGGWVNGHRASVISHDRVQIYPQSGTFDSGRLTVWGIAHA